ncbi:MAG: SCP2 sterol-binding domain-containing protein [Desulfurococcales archaeon]|nr:SCP2 sterol-binding domain-containing protein [Desulfurococcales archaeon]
MKKEKSTNIVFPSLKWAEKLCKRVNKDRYLREIGKGFNENIAIIVNVSAAQKRALVFQINDGECINVTYLDKLNEIRNDWDLVLEADMDTWIKILRLETTPTKALFTRKLKIIKGNKLMIFSRPLAHYQILYIASKLYEELE